jgi:cobalt-zinc-cadmium efflux system outer membrane protein
MLVLFPRLAAAQDAAAAERGPLSEADVIRLARSRSPAAQVAVATDELAEARTRTAGLLPNPALSWARETVDTGPTGGQGSQDLFTASVPIDIARPLATRSLVASESAWMRAEASLARTDGVLEAVLGYYEVVLAERRVEVLSQAVANLEEAARVLARREAAGSASGYESTRLSIASELSRSHLAEARGALTAARARLAALLGVRPESLRVSTGLEFMAASDEAALVRGGGESREAVRQTRDSLRLAGEAEDRADWAWLPTVELGGGMKRANNLGAASGYGYVIGVSLNIPLFDHGQAQRQQAEAQRSLATARSEALTRTIGAEVQNALATYRTAREELSRFEAQTSGQIDALLAAAQSGYREGERTIVELLDAQRAQTDVAERRLSLLGSAKRAEARLRAAAGDLR